MKTMDKAMLAEFFETAEMDSYRHLFNADKEITVTLTIDELCAVLQAHDYSIEQATAPALEHLNLIISQAHYHYSFSPDYF